MGDESGRVEQHARRAADRARAARRAPRRSRDEIIDDERECILRPARMHPLAAGVELLAVDPGSRSMAHDRHLVAGDTLALERRDMLGKMQQRHLVMARAEQQYLPARLAQLVQRRAMTEPVVPGLVG